MVALRSKWAGCPAGAHRRQPKGADVGRPLTGRARVLARRKDVPTVQTYSDHAIDKHARLREQSRGRGTGTRSLPARWVRQLPCQRPILIGATTPVTDLVHLGTSPLRR